MPPVTSRSDSEVALLTAALRQNPVVSTVLRRAADLDLPGWYLAAGCLCQTVWNVRTGRPPGEGIRDYDLVYHDSSDTSWGAEDSVIATAATLFADLPVAVEVRNEARVHLWYEDKFGVPCPPFANTEHAISCFPTTATSVGVRLDGEGAWRVYAPFGLADVLGLVVRPNRTLAPRHVYESKASRWQEQWSELTVVPWPESDGGRPGGRATG